MFAIDDPLPLLPSRRETGGRVRIAILAIAVYCSYAALCYLFQRALIYPGRAIRVPDAPPAGIEVFRLTAGAGQAEAWFLPAEGAAAGRRPAVVFFHGNAEVIDQLSGDAGLFRNLGLHVLLVEYPGYGRSPGDTSETAITAAATAAFDLLAVRPDVDPAQIVAFGRSLGGGAACALSRVRPVAALILQSPFTSLRPFARRMLLPGFLARDVFDNREALRTYRGPVLILHGRHDDVIPFSHGEDLVAASGHARFVPLDCAHNDCPPDRLQYRRELSRFLAGAGITL